ncbi:phosphoribosylglycinamide synthetase C domain-containing protein [Burkholderia gladioli]|uniref:phosphoribosylglycinamide synthetase C domain-containing protein n=1 Tax=Burkholderia gladioli TaxID=28095 RepID=UPI003D220A2A
MATPTRRARAIASTTSPRENGHSVTFHAGTQLRRRQAGHLGRPRAVAWWACRTPWRGAQQAAYDAINQINFEGMQYRRDIGHRRAEPQAGLRPERAARHPCRAAFFSWRAARAWPLPAEGLQSGNRYPRRIVRAPFPKP